MHPSSSPFTRTPASSAAKHRTDTPDRMESAKKPRHRHLPSQLAGLNDLYERNEHPSLEERTALAEQLGMETKTVSSWFQNKRASCKKRSKGTAAPTPTPYELPPISSLIASVPAPLSTSEFDEYSEDEHYPRLGHSSASVHLEHALFYAGTPEPKQLFEDNNMPRKQRSRPSHVQTEELRKLYDRNAHPSKEDREELGQKIGMRYQSVTNWFQNQRSIAKKRKEEEEAQAALAVATASAAAAAATSSKAHSYSSFPPPSGAAAAHPSLSVPPALGHPSLPPLPNARTVRRSISAVSAATSSRSSSPRVSPYHDAASHVRPRRVRPEPYQLEALKKLFRRTATPSIEERGALALEIGMDVGKVTNWFRNIRQTTRKRAQKVGDAEDDEEIDMDMDVDADDVSLATYDDWRSVSPSQQTTPSASSSSLDTPIDSVEDVKVKVEQLEKRRVYGHSSHAHSRSDMGSEEDYQEAVTPSPESSPQPPAYKPTARDAHSAMPIALEKLTYASAMEKPAVHVHTGVTVEDALLLLSFHQHIVH